MNTTHVGVIGAGIVGLAVARQMSRDGIRVTVFEKEAEVGCHQSGHNSGVVHAGIYYAPGSLKASLCRRGKALLEDYCAARQMPYETIGKVVVARSAAEIPALKTLESRAAAGGVPGLRWLDHRGLAAIEPNVMGVAALHSPTTAIVDFGAVVRALADDVRAAGGEVRLCSQVVAIGDDDAGVVVRTESDATSVEWLVICAGLQADRVARMAGDVPEPAIIPFRGEYYRLKPDRSDLVRGLVYPVPDPAYPFLGVHFTPRIGGAVDIGPNAVLALAREGYQRGDLSMSDLRELIAYRGFRRLAREHWRAGASELRTSLSRRAFIAEAREYVPSLNDHDVTPAPSGVRAQAVDADGQLVDDFRLSRRGAVLSVRNAPSPAATSSLAIAEKIASQFKN
jgi:L-2-hydroxyglutarate oxidase LhgO